MRARSFEDRTAERFQIFAAHFDRKIFGTREERQVEPDLFFTGEAMFRVDRGFAKTRDVLRPFGRKTFAQTADDCVVDIVSAEPRVSVCGQDFEDAVVQFEDRDIERAAAQIEDRDLRARLELIESVGERGGRRLVHNPFDG